jgi:hypothetical protein
MTKTSTLLFALVLGTSAQAQLPRIVVQGGGAPQVFTSLNTALAATQANDRVYLSGGSFQYQGSMIIDKPLHFIGTGIDPDSTIATGRTNMGATGGFIYCTTAATGSTFTGLNFQNWVAYGNGTNNTAFDDPTNMLFQRCRFTKFFTTEAGLNSSSTTFDECIFSEELNSAATGTTVVLLSNCLFLNSSGPNSVADGGLTAQNTVFLGTGSLQFGNNSSALYQNCIFQVPITVVNLNAIYQHCMFVDGVLPAQSTGSNNLFGQTAGTIFVNETNNVLEDTDDLRLAASSPGINAGSDGTDIGLYGGSPWKEGSVPVNPHFRQVSVAGSTDANGDLPVTITVAAQPN